MHGIHICLAACCLAGCAIGGSDGSQVSFITVTITATNSTVAEDILQNRPGQKDPRPYTALCRHGRLQSPTHDIRGIAANACTAEGGGSD